MYRRQQVWAVLAALMLVVSGSWAGAQELKSGPQEGKTPELKVFDLTGPNTGSEVDYTADRKEKPTIYLFIPADKFDRPTARFMRELDKGVEGDSDEAYIVAVWLTDDAAKTKEYLPRAQQSLQLQRTALTCFTGDKSGPADWNLHGDAHLTAVVANEGKVAASIGYVSLNETDVPTVRKALQKALGKQEKE